MKHILIICGHPDKESYNFALAKAYEKGAVESGATVQFLHINELDFNPNLQFGYRKRTDLEPDLLKAQEQLRWANHLVWVFPVWWGSVPAIMKGFLDRVLLPGFAFKKKPDSLWWDKYFTGKTARLISTMDQPTWFYRWFNGRPTYHAMKKLTMQFIGVQKVRSTPIGPIRHSSDAFRAKCLKKVEKLGFKNR